MDTTKPVFIQGYGENLFGIEHVRHMIANGEVTPGRTFIQGEGSVGWRASNCRTNRSSVNL